jgi:diaminopimelate decarboxylase
MGELARVLKAKGNPAHIVFSGVGKSHEELSHALNVGVGCINVESTSEVLRLNELAIALQKKAPIAFRINPDVDPKSHPYISTGLQENKFGIPMADALAIYKLASTLPGIQIEGLSFHIGSQITELSPIIEALDKILILIEQLKANRITIQHLNVGGGLGVRYQQEMPPKPAEYVKAILSKIKQSKEPNIKIYVEPGRAIAANAGVLLTRVEYIKNHGNRDKSFAIVDAAMNDLIRPAFYDAWQDIFSVNTNPNSDVLEKKYDVVGPICESSDFLGKDRMLFIKEGELLAIGSAGAYGFSMSSNYNSRPRVAEVMVDKDRFQVVRSRETIDDLFAAETLLTN